MRKSIFLIAFPLIMLALLSISCKSSPAPVVEEEVPTFEGQDQKPPDVEGLKDLTARMEEARKRAIDFETPSYFPSDWEAVESQYAAVGQMAKTNDAEVQQAASLTITITDAYDDLFKKTIPLYVQARDDEIMAVRDELIGTGLTDVFPGYLQNADEIALLALEQYDNEDYYKARDTAVAALNEYETLLTGARAFLKRQEIVDRGFSMYDPENFAKADEIALTAVGKYEAGDKKAAVESAEEALLRYNVVLANSWIAYAGDQRASASSERELAIENKANIAVRESFREADAVFNNAEENFKAQKFEEAAVLFTESEALFTLAGQDTEEKRKRAMETIRIAEEKIEGSSETATEAEKIIEGGSR